MQSYAALVIVVSLIGLSPAYAGPCAAQLAQIEKQSSVDDAGLSEGPSAPQTIGAQLGRQPTPASVHSAERKAGTLVQAALNRVRKADEAGDAVGCHRALSQLKDLYGIP